MAVEHAEDVLVLLEVKVVDGSVLLYPRNTFYVVSKLVLTASFAVQSPSDKFSV